MRGNAGLQKDISKLALNYERLQAHVTYLETNFVKSIVKETITEMQRQQSDPLKKEMIRQLNRNRQRIIKRKILELLHGNKMELAELKYLIVDQHKYCSKATFYRYIQDLEISDLVNFMIVGTKEFVVAAAKQSND
ncbi:hypothetical protein J4475_03565 [Candidatus Woesearchaeota archaeon]|nr:hypothetical protein [Candidatus Woesearchaeota archaeon]